MSGGEGSCLVEEVVNKSWNIQEDPVTIYEDNQATIKMSKNGIDHKRSKHIDIQYHFVKEKVEAKAIELKYMPTREMVADTFTKALPRDAFERHRLALGLQILDNKGEC